MSSPQPGIPVTSIKVASAFKYHTMNMNECTAQCMINLGVRWKSVASFTFRMLTLKERALGTN
jgi:hypothetical protein